MGLGATETERAARVLGRGAKAMKEVEAATVASTVAVKGFASNTRMMSEASTILSDVVSGNFGRIRRSAAAMLNASGALQGLFSATGAAILVTAAAVVAFVIAEQRASAQTAAYNRTLAETSNFAGVTASQMDAMAHSVKGVSHTTGEFAAALVEVNATGRFVGEQLQKITQAALDFATVTGGSVKEAIKVFESLGEKPVEASVKLNEQYHYLTASVYDQIVALDKQGDSVGAAHLAIESYTDFLASSRGEVEANLSTMAWLWDDIKNKANGAADAMAAAVRVLRSRTTRSDEYLSTLSTEAAAKAELDTAKKDVLQGAYQDASGGPAGVIAGYQATFDAAHKATQAFQSQDNAKEKAATDAGAAKQAEGAYIAAENHLDEISRKYDPALRKQAELNDLLATYRKIQEHNPNDKRLTDGSLEERSADIEDGGAKKGRKTRTPVDKEANAYNALNKSIAEHMELLRETDAGTIKLDATEQFAAKVLQDLNDKTNKLNAADKARIRTSIEKLLALDKETQAGIKQAAALKQLDEMSKRNATREAELAVRMHDAAMAEIDLIERGNVDRKLENNLKQIGIFYDEREIELKAKLQGADAAVTKQIMADLQGLEDKRHEAAQQALADAAKVKAAQADWRNGARAALNEYSQQAQDVAGMAHSAFTNAFQGMEDALVNFVTTGKLNFKQLAASILSDLARIEIRILLSKVLQSMFGGGGGDGGAAAANGLSDSGYGLDFTPHFAGGTNYAPGGMATVGENGPEQIFLPRGSRVIPNGQQQGGDSGSVAVNTTIVIGSNGNSSSKTDATGDQKNANQIADMVNNLITKALVREQRQGGMLWKQAMGQ